MAFGGWETNEAKRWIYTSVHYEANIRTVHDNCLADGFPRSTTYADIAPPYVDDFAINTLTFSFRTHVSKLRFAQKSQI